MNFLRLKNTGVGMARVETQDGKTHFLGPSQEVLLLEGNIKSVFPDQDVAREFAGEAPEVEKTSDGSLKRKKQK